MLRAMRPWLRPRRSVAHRTGVTLVALLVGACGSSAARSGPTGSSSASAPVASASTPSSSASTPSSAPPGPPVCGPAGARTLAASSRARVYAVGAQVFGCARGSGKRFAIGSQRTCLRTAFVGPFAVAGVKTAFAVKRCGVDTGTSTIVVRRLDTGRVIGQQPANTSPIGPESSVTVSAIVLGQTGAVAWITQAASIVGHRRATAVHAAGAHGARVLDSGSAIDPHSLTLRGGRVRWRHGASWRSAALA